MKVKENCSLSSMSLVGLCLLVLGRKWSFGKSICLSFLLLLYGTTIEGLGGFHLFGDSAEPLRGFEGLRIEGCFVWPGAIMDTGFKVPELSFDSANSYPG